MCSMARNIVWPFACFSTQRIELPHKDQIHGSGLLACRACMLSVFLSLFFFLKLCLPLLLKQLGGGEKKPFGIHLCHIGSFIITNGKAILQKY